MVRIGLVFPTKEQGTLDEMVERIREAEAMGFASVWSPQSSGFDAITMLSIAGHHVDRIELGTAVVPTYPRHPVALAVQALTASAATSGRFALGIGLSHKRSIEGNYGISYDKPARHMREYLSILLPMLHERSVQFEGETLTARTQVSIPGATPPPVLLAALQPRMLELAGAQGDGTITWCTGPVTLEEQIVPLITRAAEGAGKSTRVVVALPAIVTNDEADGRVKAGEQLAGYENIPVYRAVLDREGVQGPADISIVGDEASFTAQVKRLEDLGATDFIALPTGTTEERQRTKALLVSLAS